MRVQESSLACGCCSRGGRVIGRKPPFQLPLWLPTPKELERAGPCRTAAPATKCESKQVAFNFKDHPPSAIQHPPSAIQQPTTNDQRPTTTALLPNLVRPASPHRHSFPPHPVPVDSTPCSDPSTRQPSTQPIIRASLLPVIAIPSFLQCRHRLQVSAVSVSRQRERWGYCYCCCCCSPPPPLPCSVHDSSASGSPNLSTNSIPTAPAHSVISSTNLTTPGPLQLLILHHHHPHLPSASHRRRIAVAIASRPHITLVIYNGLWNEHRGEGGEGEE